MNRVERSLDMSGGAFSLFQAAILYARDVEARLPPVATRQSEPA